jgi:adenylate kinase family enzyme
MLSSKLPQIIILYGPPASGKGTQSHILKQKLPDYYHLDFGSELRQFVKENIGEFHQDEEVINPKASPENLEVARRIKNLMKNSSPVETRDLRFVIESAINECVAKGQGMIIEGPGRLVEEAKWLSGFLGQKNVETVIYHLYISLDEVLQRSSTRYYLPSTKKPFKSFEAAKLEAKDGEEPYQRPEDKDPEGTKKRYKELYSDNFAKIISIYQLQAKSLVFTIDASDTVENISQKFVDYLEVFYGVKI